MEKKTYCIFYYGDARSYLVDLDEDAYRNLCRLIAKFDLDITISEPIRIQQEEIYSLPTT